VATQLTLRMDERLIEAAKRHAAARGTSVSRMVAALDAGFGDLEGGVLHEAGLVADDVRPLERQRCSSSTGG